jgi:transposase
VIVDVEATRSIRQAEVGSVRTILDRVKDKFDLHPERIIADTAYGSGPMLGWLVDRKIAPHIPVIDKATRTDGTWSRTDFEWDADNNQYFCPEGEELKQFRRNYSAPNRGPDGITAGQVSDYTGAAALMNGLPEAEWLLADRGYDADLFRETLVDKGTKPCIPGRKSRKKAAKYDKRRYKRRNRIERMFGRLKDRRRVATRYDRSPTVFLSAIVIF